MLPEAFPFNLSCAAESDRFGVLLPVHKVQWRAHLALSSSGILDNGNAYVSYKRIASCGYSRPVAESWNFLSRWIPRTFPMELHNIQPLLRKPSHVDEEDHCVIQVHVRIYRVTVRLLPKITLRAGNKNLIPCFNITPTNMWGKTMEKRSLQLNCLMRTCFDRWHRSIRSIHRAWRYAASWIRNIRGSHGRIKSWYSTSQLICELIAASDAGLSDSAFLLCATLGAPYCHSTPKEKLLSSFFSRGLRVFVVSKGWSLKFAWNQWLAGRQIAC